MKKLLALLLATLTLLCAFTACGKKEANKESANPTEGADQSALVMNGSNYGVDTGAFTYFFMNNYLQTQSYAQYLGFSNASPLKDQSCTISDTEDYTWHDYFVDMTKESVNEILVLCEAAKEQNITLNKADHDLISQTIKEFKNMAAQQNLDFDKFITTYFGDKVTEDALRTCMELQLLAGKAADTIKNRPKYTDAQLESERESNKENYYFSDYRFIEIKANYVTGANESAIAAAKENSKKKAQEILAAATDEASFLKAAEQYYISTYGDNVDTKEVESKVQATLKQGYAYETKSDLGKWLYEQTGEGEHLRRAGDTKLVADEENGKYTIYYVVRACYYKTDKLRNVRHILITVDENTPDEKAKAEAEAILNEWKNGEATEESFAALATQKTTDTGSKESGGLYEDVDKGQMVAEFENWLFAAKEKGETGIVKTSYGYHIMYYVGENETESWKLSAENNLRNADYAVAYEELLKKHTIEIDEDALKLIEQAGI